MDEALLRTIAIAVAIAGISWFVMDIADAFVSKIILTVAIGLAAAIGVHIVRNLFGLTSST